MPQIASLVVRTASTALLLHFAWWPIVPLLSQLWWEGTASATIQQFTLMQAAISAKVALSSMPTARHAQPLPMLWEWPVVYAI